MTKLQEPGNGSSSNDSAPCSPSATDTAFKLLSCGGNDSTTVRSTLEAFSAHVDEEYFQLKNEAHQPTPEDLLLFRKDRAISALVFALSSAPSKLHEALHEVISASDNQSKTMRLVEAALMAR